MAIEKSMKKTCPFKRGLCSMEYMFRFKIGRKEREEKCMINEALKKYTRLHYTHTDEELGLW